MACYHPLKAFRAMTLNPSGKNTIIFDERQDFIERLTFSCGRCIGCKLKNSKTWAIRCMHEASLHTHNSFLTLTYNQQALENNTTQTPAGPSLNLHDFQNFVKKVRKALHKKKRRTPPASTKYLESNLLKNLRYYHCGEYGEQFQRPHFHACMFNLDFADKKHYKTVNGEKLYTSQTLDKLWPHGFSTIGELTLKSAAYVARYIMKKQYGRKAEEHYAYLDEYGEKWIRKPEYSTMSKRPAIGKEWFEKYQKDCFPKDFVTIDGKKYPIPRTYGQWFEQTYPDEWEDVKEKRIIANETEKKLANNTSARLKTREQVHTSRVTTLIRSYEK